jgi:hypothetical protein
MSSLVEAHAQCVGIIQGKQKMDILIHNLQNQLDRIEDKIDERYKLWLTSKEVVRLTGCSLSTIKRAVKNGELQVSANKGKNLYRREWIDRWLIG